MRFVCIKPPAAFFCLTKAFGRVITEKLLKPSFLCPVFWKSFVIAAIFTIARQVKCISTYNHLTPPAQALPGLRRASAQFLHELHGTR